MTHQYQEKKQRKETKSSPAPPPPRVKEIQQAFALYFNGAYKRQEGRAAVGMVVLNPIKEKVMLERGIGLLNVSSNNEAEYAALIEGLEWCVSNDISFLNVFEDSMLIVTQVQGIWSYKSDKLASKLQEVKGFLIGIKQC